MAMSLIGLAATLASDFTRADIDTPSKLIATLAIACLCATHIIVSFSTVCFDGELFFTIFSMVVCFVLRSLELKHNVAGKTSHYLSAIEGILYIRDQNAIAVCTA
jgi:hypothetical protein